MRIPPFAGVGTLAAALLLSVSIPASAQNTAALTGKVTSAEEGAMEGVIVSAKRNGSTITISVVSDKDGNYSFPASKLEPGQYGIKIRAVGYDLASASTATVAAQKTATQDIKLKKTADIAAQLTNAEWMASIPGTDSQKGQLLNCVGCHTLERIMKSAYDADGFLQIFQRMANYYPGSTPLKPQRLPKSSPLIRSRKGSSSARIRRLPSTGLASTRRWYWSLCRAAKA